MYRDPSPDVIRDHPRFQAVVDRIEADLAQQLDNVREMERNGALSTLGQSGAELLTERELPQPSLVN